MSEIAYTVELEKMEMKLQKTIHHDNIFHAVGPRGEYDMKGIYSIYGYFDDHHRWSTPLCIIGAPYEIRRDNYPIYPISIPRNDLDKWMCKMWDDHCQSLGIKQMKNGLGPLILNMINKRTTVEKFMDYIKANQHTLKTS